MILSRSVYQSIALLLKATRRTKKYNSLKCLTITFHRLGYLVSAKDTFPVGQTLIMYKDVISFALWY